MVATTTQETHISQTTMVLMIIVQQNSSALVNFTVSGNRSNTLTVQLNTGKHLITNNVAFESISVEASIAPTPVIASNLSLGRAIISNNYVHPDAQTTTGEFKVALGYYTLIGNVAGFFTIDNVYDGTEYNNLNNIIIQSNQATNPGVTDSLGTTGTSQTNCPTHSC